MDWLVDERRAADQRCRDERTQHEPGSTRLPGIGLSTPVLRTDGVPIDAAASRAADLGQTVVDSLRPLVHWIDSGRHLESTGRVMGRRAGATSYLFVVAGLTQTSGSVLKHKI